MKHLPFLASLLLAATPPALLLPGCGGGNGGPMPTNTPLPTSTTASTPTLGPTSTPTATATTTATPNITPTNRPVREFYVDVSPATVVEGHSGQKALRFIVSGYDTYGEHFPLSFSYQTVDGSATAGQDYTATSGKSSVVTGSTTTITVPVLGDTLVEEDETLTFRVFEAQGRYSTTERTGTITNDD